MDWATGKASGEMGRGNALPVRLVLHREAVQGEIDLGDEGRFFPTDTALARWKASTHGQATVVYD